MIKWLPRQPRWMANRHMEYSASLALWKLDHNTVIHLLKWNSEDCPSQTCKQCRTTDIPDPAGRIRHETNGLAVLDTVKLTLQDKPSTDPSEWCLPTRNENVHSKSTTQIFTNTLFLNHKPWCQPECSSERMVEQACRRPALSNKTLRHTVTCVNDKLSYIDWKKSDPPLIKSTYQIVEFSEIHKYSHRRDWGCGLITKDKLKGIFNGAFGLIMSWIMNSYLCFKP